MARGVTGHALRGAGQDELHEYSLQALDRIARPIGGKFLLSTLWPLIDAWSKSPEWERRHAALLSIAQIAEGCAKVLTQDNALKALVGICCTAANDAHPIVKWCACQAIGQVCTGATLCLSSVPVQIHVRRPPPTCKAVSQLFCAKRCHRGLSHADTPTRVQTSSPRSRRSTTAT